MQCNNLRRLLAIAAILVSSSSALAQSEIPENKWIVDWGEQRCSMVRMSGGSERVTLVLRASLGTHRPELVLTKEGEGKPLPGLDVNVDVTLAPAGTALIGFGQALRSEGGKRVLFITNLPEDFFDQFAASKEVVVGRKGRELIRMSYTHAPAAIRNLKACNDDLLASWGIDPKILNALQRKPTPSSNPGSWLTSSDYPEAARRTGRSGSTVIRFTLGVDGQFGDCATIVSSGSADLDAQSCRSLSGRARYAPALDGSGQPVAVKMIETVHWVLPTG
jgi:TonB family protein